MQNKYPKMLVFGSANHYLNLVDKAVTPPALKQIVEIQTYFRNHHRPCAFLMQKKGMMPQIPNETRWSSQCECVRTFCENWHIYNEIVNTYDDDAICSQLKLRKKLETLITIRLLSTCVISYQFFKWLWINCKPTI